MNANQRDSACDRAYRDHASDVYRVAYGMLRDADEALDATHDSFARAWERWEQYDANRPLRPWLLSICVRVCLDHLRRRRLRWLVAPSVDGLDTRLGDPDPASEVIQRRIVEQAMAALSPQSRAVVVLRHYYGYDYAQIGEMLGKPAGTVGSLLSRAHTMLRSRLNDTAAAAELTHSWVPSSTPGQPARERTEG